MAQKTPNSLKPRKPQITPSNPIPPNNGNPPRYRQIGPKGQGGGIGITTALENDDPQHGTHERRQQDGQRQYLPATPGPQHGQQLEVAITHAFLASDQLEYPVHRPQAQITGHSTPQCRMDASEQPGTVDDQPQPQHLQNNGVRQKLGIGVNQAQRDQGPGQQQHRTCFPAKAELPGHHPAQHGSQQFNQRIANTDPLPTVAAAAPQQGIADQWQILPGLDLGVTVRAMGVGQNQVIGGSIRLHCIGMQYFLSLPFPVPFHHARQTVDDYIEKATDDQAQQHAKQNKGQHVAGHIGK